MTANIERTSVGSLRESLEKAKKRIQQLRGMAEEAGEQTASVALVVGGGALSGYVEHEFGVNETTGVSYSTALGILATAAGVFGLAGSYSDQACDLGKGILAHQAGDAVMARLKG
jgi:hypothetical protein